ncbi:transcriptional regulator family: Fungal Specific TF [Penicillium longicatenatum]|uniref:transcriptional regulator family: Fungal Specific TF n=1 Tax=Penicillium longicatenatum TaxID=1561947 RepID=UPI0025467EF8|nr:transcriptional regulator family: Fungal Specific TF [Penicillium longicatenatum]KAJ5639953.1 transcriptional regulator family: Fungal Specific TF [Penicillium longicatenatum]
MNRIRQERKSCEACRTRKLRCSGEKSGCSRCRGLALPCNFKDKGLPGRPRKLVRPEQREEAQIPSREERTGSSGSSQFSPAYSQSPFITQGTCDSLMAAGQLDPLPFELSNICGFDSFQYGSTGICSSPTEPWQALCDNGHRDLELPSKAMDSYISPVSFSQSCKCDEEVSDTVRNLSQASMSNDVLQVLRMGVSLAERLLICPLCYDISKPPRVTVQNVLLIGQLMLGITSTYQNYIKWLYKHCTELDAKKESELVYLDSGLGFPSELSLQLSGAKFRGLVMHGLRKDGERLSALGKAFAQRQRNRHMAGHEACPDLGGQCRKKEYFGADHDPLDLCPLDPAARRLVPCFRIVDEVRGMIQQVEEALT